MTSIYEQATIVDAVSGAELAQVALNGTQIKAGATLASSGRMRSFKLLGGNLRQSWYAHRTMTLQYDDVDYAVRIAALPSGVGAMGFVEFVGR